ncbi:amino acid adenylation domain-containing protein [Parapedobacter sp. ISTM3]|uniref:non-ribosomal peptide synthetase n=1 Tax=Parapedobacter sp. ISTM3 TaxID=2800130 RepID=UPI00190740E2|nr:non-ribosomal peptide synthetase [Parapedobacter sp. ISTM3]MBK1439221.1 amino acid adenylation domain-containing protein [Parapedobacter sp. ISTM3]
MNSTTNLQLIPVAYDPFSGGEIEKIISPIEPQQEIWLSCMIGGDEANRAYNESVSIRFSGVLDITALSDAMRTVIQRHEALRCSFSRDGRSIYIYMKGKSNFIVKDLRSLPLDIQKKQLDKYHETDAKTPFDLEEGPLVRTTLFQLSDTEHLFTLTAHHIICDGWSLGTIFEDLSRFYSAAVQGTIPQATEWTTMSTYAEEIRSFVDSADYIQTTRYWLNKYKGGIPQLALPLDFPRPKMRTYKSRRDDYRIDKEFAAKIKELGAKVGSSFVITLLTAYEVFIHRLTGQDDIVIGLPAAGQSATGHFSLVGHCVNLLPIRSKIDGQVSFLDHLKRRKSAILDDLDHQQISFGTLLQKLNVKRDPSQIPLVSVVFNIDMGMNSNVSFYGTTHRLISNPREYETFDIFLNVSGSEEALTLEWSYNTQLFKPTTIAAMMRQFTDLLNTVIAQPSVKLMDISINQDAEADISRHTTEVAYPKDKPFTAYITEIAAATPDKTAIKFKNKAISYRELEERSNQLANYLVAKGVTTGAIIGVALDRSIDMVIALLGVVKSGAAYIPLDPSYPVNRIEFMLHDSAAKFLLTESKYSRLFDSQAKELLYDELLTDLCAYPSETPQRLIQGDNLVYVLYTSGSTGNPKGVQIEHHSLSNLLLSVQQEPGIHTNDTLLGVTTISFDIAGVELYLPLIAGATLLLADAETARDGKQLLHLATKEHATIIQATPATWRMMLESGWTAKLPIKAICCGEAFPKDLAYKLLEKCQSVWNMYGPTETTIFSTGKELTKDSIDQITIGKPIANTRVYVLNEAYRPLGVGQEGQLFIAGSGVARGYVNRPELTAEKFVADIMEPDTKMYATGDLGILLDNGEYLCLGRIDHQVKIRGHRIELGEIEHHLSTLDGIKNAVVMAREDAPGNQRLVAYLIIERTKISREDIKIWREALSTKLPNYMLPNDWVAIDAFPLTANGKIDRKALPKPSTSSAVEGARHESALTTNEQKVFDIWAAVFKTTDIRKDDDFFELGGHSLLAVEVITRIEKQLGKRLPLASLFNSPTIEKLALLLDDEETLQWNLLVPIKPEGKKPPLYIVHGAGMNVLAFQPLSNHLDPDQPVYGLQAKGLDGVTAPAETVQEIAKDYVDEICKHYPSGPYAIAGYSAGGTIAIEMAKQLKDAGQEVLFVGLIDSYPHNVSNDYKTVWNRGLGHFLKFIYMKAMHVLVYLFKYPKTYLRDRYNYIRGFIYNIFKRFFPDTELIDTEPAHIKAIQCVHERAMRHYHIPYYDGAVWLFRTTVKTTYFLNYRTNAWDTKLFNRFLVVNIDGEHSEIFKPAFVKILGKRLQAELNHAKTMQEASTDRCVGEA